MEHGTVVALDLPGEHSRMCTGLKPVVPHGWILGTSGVVTRLSACIRTGLKVAKLDCKFYIPVAIEQIENAGPSRETQAADLQERGQRSVRLLAASKNFRGWPQASLRGC